MAKLSAGIFLALCGMVSSQSLLCSPDGEGSLYDFSATLVDQSATIPFSDYAGKVVLAVNVASFCGLTPHYIGLNVLQEQYGPDLQVLGFPCNQFSYQEPGANATEIYNSIGFVRPGNGFVPNFPLFAKSEVNGPNASPLYKFLKSKCPSPEENFREKLRITHDAFNSRDIRWNFEKFLIGPDGQPYMRFSPPTVPEEIAPFIEELLAKHKIGINQQMSPLKQL